MSDRESYRILNEELEQVIAGEFAAYKRICEGLRAPFEAKVGRRDRVKASLAETAREVEKQVPERSELPVEIRKAKADGPHPLIQWLREREREAWKKVEGAEKERNGGAIGGAEAEFDEGLEEVFTRIRVGAYLENEAISRIRELKTFLEELEREIPRTSELLKAENGQKESLRAARSADRLNHVAGQYGKPVDGPGGGRHLPGS